MNRTCLWVAVLLLGPTALHGEARQPTQLILSIIVDQFRYKYTIRFAALYTGGPHTLSGEDAVYLDAHEDYFPPVTAAGHAGFLTGLTPATRGIVGKEWYDRAGGTVASSSWYMRAAGLGRRCNAHRSAKGALGRRNGADLLTVSFSANGPLGHAAPEMGDISMRTDRNQFAQTVNDAMSKRWNAGNWLLANSEIGMWLTYDLHADNCASRKLRQRRPYPARAAAAAHQTRPYTSTSLKGIT